MTVDPVIGAIAGTVLGAVSSLMVGTTMYAIRRRGHFEDTISKHGERLAAIEARLVAIEHLLRQTSPGG